jgi:hypothetical protein
MGEAVASARSQLIERPHQRPSVPGDREWRAGNERGS